MEVAITRGMRARGNRVGKARQDFHDQRGTANSYNLNCDYEKSLQINKQGALAELVVATVLGVGDSWVECVEDYQSLAGDVIPGLQVRSTYNPAGPLILHPKDRDGDAFVLVRLARDNATAHLAGWAWGAEGKRDEFWPGKYPDRPCFMVPDEHLRPWPPPIANGAIMRPVERRDRDNRRPRKRRDVDCIGDGPLTCPRCGWPAKHLVMPYYESPWREHGGLCGQCCVEAAAAFGAKGWPESLPEEVIYGMPSPDDLPVQQAFPDAEVVSTE